MKTSFEQLLKNKDQADRLAQEAATTGDMKKFKAMTALSNKCQKEIDERKNERE